MTDLSAEIGEETVVSKMFDKTSGPGSALPFKDNKHNFFLFSISHTGVPPIATDPTNPAIRIYGTFASAVAAKNHAARIMKADPTCHLGIGETHKWTLVANTIKSLQDEKYVNDKTSKLLKRHEIELSVREAKFKQHQEELRNATVIKDEVPLETGKLDESEPDNMENTTIEEVDSNLPVLTSDCIPVNQSVYCVSFVNDDPAEDVPEFLFKVYRTCRDDTEADGYVRNVASRNVIDNDIYVVDTGEWVHPLTDSKYVPKTYRDKRLNDMMKRDMTPDELLKEMDERDRSMKALTANESD